MREVRLDLALHPRYLFADRVGELALTRAASALGFVRQDGERSLQAVCEVSGSRYRALDRLLAVVEQQVEVVDERLHFGGVGARRRGVHSLDARRPVSGAGDRCPTGRFAPERGR